MLAALCSAPGQMEETLTANVTTAAPVIRSRAPIPLKVRINWAGRGILTGDLMVTLSESDGFRSLKLFVNRRSEIAINEGPNLFQVTLPATHVQTDGRLEAMVQFRTTEGSLVDLGTFPIPQALMGDQGFTILVASPKFGGEQVTDAYDRSQWSWFRLERLLQRDDSRNSSGAITYPAFQGKDFLPRYSIDYCSYNIALFQDGIDWVGDRELQALTEWVRAGGCLIIKDALNKQSAKLVGFLESLSGGTGRFDEIVSEPIGVHVELGRMLVLPSDFGYVPESERRVEPMELEEGADPQKIAFLPLKPPLPKKRFGSLLEFVWRLETQSDNRIERVWGDLTRQAPVPDDGDYQVDINYQPGPLRPGRESELNEELMPSGVEGVPFKTIALFVVIFIVLSGPVDYVVLGRLRKRFFTWVVHPTVAAAITLAIVSHTNQRLATDASGGSLTILDLGTDGSVLCENQLRLHFAYKEQVYSKQFQNALFTRMGPNRPTHSHWSADGQFPSWHTTDLSLGKWSPVVTRRMTIANTNRELPGIDWDITGGVSSKGAPNEAIGEHLWDANEGILPANAFIVVWGLNRPMYRSTNDSSQTRYWASFLRDSNRSGERFAFQRSWLNNHYMAVEVRGHVHSPSGSPLLEDLSRTDTSEGQAVVAAVVWPEGEDLVVLRRAYWLAESRFKDFP